MNNKEIFMKKIKISQFIKFTLNIIMQSRGNLVGNVNCCVVENL